MYRAAGAKTVASGRRGKYFSPALLCLLTGFTDDVVLPEAADFNGDGKTNLRDELEMMLAIVNA